MIKKILRISQYPKYLRFLFWRVFVFLKMRSNGVKIGSGVTFYGFPIVSLSKQGMITIGDGCSLCSSSEFTALGVNHPVILRLLRPGASIRIGAHTGISGGVICAAASVEIGNNVLLGANVTIVDTDFHAIKADGRRYNADPKDIKTEAVFIEDNVFIGANTIVLKGAKIGKNSVIGAGSVVTGTIPSDVIAAGNPAKVIKPLSQIAS